MNTRERLTQWWKWHEGWIAAGVLAVIMLAIGWTSAMVRTQMLMAQQQAWHNRELANMADAYREALSSRDKLLDSLTARAVKATNTAAVAANTAAVAADTARKAAKPAAENPKLKGWIK